MTKHLAPRNWLYASILISIVMLASAHAFENFGKMFPCDLCLKQREPYWAVIAIALSVLVLSKAKPTWPLAKSGAIAIGLAFLYGAGYAIFHSGVEMGIFHTGCTSSGFDPSQPLGLEEAMVVGKCDEPPLVIFGITMANVNAVISLVLAGLSFASALGKPQN